EVQMRGREEFVENGGEDLVLIPSLNSEDAWVHGISRIVKDYHPNK
ncbi:MAG: ferrochelatase, partial [Proteobacteria bacterium]|nr:ferrochelatase [Pseudomonadota bacterium]NDD05734.1 ferrochelatase [Pseudomonadota bacterium]